MGCLPYGVDLMKIRTAASAALIAALLLASACVVVSEAPDFVYNTATFPEDSGAEPSVTVPEETASSADYSAEESSDESGISVSGESGQAHDSPKSADTAPTEEAEQPAHTVQSSRSGSSGGSTQTALPIENEVPLPDTPGGEEAPENTEPDAPAEPEDEQVPPLPDDPADMAVTYDPLHSINIELDGFAVRIYGCYIDAGITDAKMNLNRTSDLKISSDGGSFEVSFLCRNPWGKYDSILLAFDDGHTMDFRVKLTDSGLEPLQSPALERNRSVVNMARDLPSEGVGQYIGGSAEEVLAEIQSISDEICKGISGKYDKARAIAGWVAENIYYDSDASETAVYEETISLAQTLKTHRTVCGGFANLYSALCAAQGIRCLNIIGTCINGYNSFTENADDAHYHEWTALDLGGRLIWVDTTWNTFNKYSKGKYSKKGLYWQYFDISDELISNDHRADLCEYRDYFALLES